MDKKFLQKVIDQLVYETRIDYEKGEIEFPFLPQLIPIRSFHCRHFTHPPLFSKHCKNVYGLNYDEIEYVWNEYEQIVKDKIKNNG
jgi:hypothetical protein